MIGEQSNNGSTGDYIILEALLIPVRRSRLARIEVTRTRIAVEGSIEVLLLLIRGEEARIRMELPLASSRVLGPRRDARRRRLERLPRLIVARRGHDRVGIHGRAQRRLSKQVRWKTRRRTCCPQRRSLACGASCCTTTKSSMNSCSLSEQQIHYESL